MNAVFLYALVRRCGDFVGIHRLRCWRIGRAGNAGCECGRGQHGGREQNGRDFPVHSHTSFGALVNWDRPYDHAASCTPLDVKDD